MENEAVKKILFDLEAGYDSIAGKFSSTRAFMWRDLEFAKDLVKQDDRVLDFGCGNGRLAGLIFGKLGREGRLGKSGEYVGVDVSQKLVDIANQRYHSEKTEFIKIEHTRSAHKSDKAESKNRLPFEDNYFDAVFSIAVFHHFPSREYTQEIIQELSRVLKPGGKIVITVWNLWQKQYLKYHKKSKKDWLDAEIPFKSGEKVFKRYHHPFKTEELKKLLQKSGFNVQSCRENYNIICIASKK